MTIPNSRGGAQVRVVMFGAVSVSGTYRRARLRGRTGPGPAASSGCILLGRRSRRRRRCLSGPTSGGGLTPKCGTNGLVDGFAQKSLLPMPPR